MLLYTTLRLIHILSGVFWTGANVMMAAYITPSVQATAPESRSFLQHLAQKSGFPRAAEISGWLTILAGAGLYYIISNGFQAEWFATRRGIVLSIGALLAITAMIVSYALSKPAGKRLGQIAQEIQAAGGPPTPEQVADLQAQQKKLARGGRWAAILLTLAVAMMAISR